MSEAGEMDYGKFLVMVLAAKADIALMPGTQTTVLCSHCGSGFTISVNNSNGHARGACSGENCDLSFIE